MRKKTFVTSNIKKQKRLYYILIGLALVAFIIGILFLFIISDDNKLLINQKLKEYFSHKNDEVAFFFKSLFNNFIFIIVLWTLGISIIGIPIIIVLLLFKSFIFGFSISSIVSTFGIKGLLISLIHTIISNGIYLIIVLLVTFYSITFSVKLFKSLFLRKNIDFKDSINKYIKILLISLSTSVIISIYESFISNNILNLFI